MSIPGSAEPLFLAQQDTGGYQIQRSLRFNSSDSAFLSRAVSTAGDRKTFTFSAWVKRCKLGTIQVLFAANSGSSGVSSEFNIYFAASDIISIGYGSADWRDSVAVFRDVSAWYHILVAVDTTQASDSERIKLYVNGVDQQLTSLRAVTQNVDTAVNSAVTHYLGSTTAYYCDVYIADPRLIDGQRLTPSSFTEVSATTGQLLPRQYTGSFGTNGFWLKFSDNSAATATTLGKDYSGNSNNWTPNNLSVTAGAGNDSLVDTPVSSGTDTGVGGVVTGNYCTLNPLVNISGHTFRNGNLEAVTSSSNYGTFVSTIAMPPSGKWYAEAYISATSGYPLVGIAGTGCTFGTTSYLGGQATMYAYYGVNGNKYNNGTSSSYGATYTTGDTIGIAYDADAGTITFYKNGSSQGQAYSSITSGSYYFAGNEFNSASGTQIWNFGQRAWAYTPPANHRPLVDTLLPAPVVAKPSTAMDVKLYTGNGSTQTISGLGFSPDLVWIKNRTSAYNHGLWDTVRGATNALYSSLTNAEGTESGVSAFNSDGFSVGSSLGYNKSSDALVAWTWDAGTTTTTNTVGSITSQVRANASAGFSIVTYSGSGSSATVGHGLGVAPQMVIAKRRNASGWDWPVWHSSLTSGTYTLFLDLTNAQANRTDIWDGVPTSSVFKVNTSGQINDGSGTYVAYCFAPVAGYSSAFLYSGNGDSSGPFVYLGFRPRLILLKRTDSANNWILMDTARDTYNSARYQLLPNVSDSEYTVADTLDILSNGFKLRDTNASRNASGGTYVGFAWAEHPFAYARAR